MQTAKWALFPQGCKVKAALAIDDAQWCDCHSGDIYNLRFVSDQASSEVQDWATGGTSDNRDRQTELCCWFQCMDFLVSILGYKLDGFCA